jgi:adenylyltransferase/sulfurtransferase
MPDAPPTLSPAELARYSRHILLGQIGVAGQRKLAASRVLVVGAGGLGSPAALYLAAAGVGTLGLADFDTVALHNLQRQLLHDTDAVGQPKVDSAARRLHAINPHVRLVLHRAGITAENALPIFADYDIVVDGTDNFGTRYLNNDAAFFARRPLVYGSVFKFEGQVAVFDPHGGGPCYRCLFPEPPAPGSVPGCGEAGVIGALCGVIGSLQALETIKLLTATGEPLRGRLLTYDALAPRFTALALPRSPGCPLCGTQPTITRLAAATYAACAPSRSSLLPMPDSADHPLEITVHEAREIRAASPQGSLILDVREPFERDICAIAESTHIPMRQIPESLATLPPDRHILVLCHAGGRSRRVTEFLRANGFTAVSNIAGGIDAWAEQIEPGMRRY